MARFYGSLQGQAKTEATRRGGPASGLQAHVRGWNIGARVELSADGDKDVVRVYRTHGSNGSGPDTLLAELIA